MGVGYRQCQALQVYRGGPQAGTTKLSLLGHQVDGHGLVATKYDSHSVDVEYWCSLAKGIRIFHTCNFVARKPQIHAGGIERVALNSFLVLYKLN